MYTAFGFALVEWFDSKSGQTNDLNNDIRSFPAFDAQVLKGLWEEQADKFTCCDVGGALSGIPPYQQ